MVERGEHAPEWRYRVRRAGDTLRVLGRSEERAMSTGPDEYGFLTDEKEGFETIVEIPVGLDREAMAPYYAQVREKLASEPPHIANHTIDSLKRARFDAGQKTWRDVLPANVLAWADETLRREKEENGDPCIDNERVARLSSSSQVRRFRKVREHGCCGSTEFVRVGPDGERYVFGFNFGH